MQPQFLNEDSEFLKTHGSYSPIYSICDTLSGGGKEEQRQRFCVNSSIEYNAPASSKDSPTNYNCE